MHDFIQIASPSPFATSSLNFPKRFETSSLGLHLGYVKAVLKCTKLAFSGAVGIYVFVLIVSGIVAVKGFFRGQKCYLSVPGIVHSSFQLDLLEQQKRIQWPLFQEQRYLVWEKG